MFNGQEIIPVEPMIGKKRVGLNFDLSFDKANFRLKTPNYWGILFFNSVVYCNHKSDLV
jgi:hypothetical protein